MLSALIRLILSIFGTSDTNLCGVPPRPNECPSDPSGPMLDPHG